jgi:hypothetical protein
MCGGLRDFIAARAPVLQKSFHAKPVSKLIRLFAALLLLAFGLGSAWAQRMYDSSGRQLGRIDVERYYSDSASLMGLLDG